MSSTSYTDGFFSIDSQNGFIPVRDPLERLPEKYNTLQEIVERLHHLVVLENIKFETLTQLVMHNLKDYTDMVNEETDVFVIQALFRAYAFLTSAWLLEPAYLHFRQKGEYGQARTFVPRNIAVPFKAVADKLGVFPFLDYHYAYSLGNYVKIDKSKGLNWKNLKMAVSFTGTDDESGFIMLHVYINELSKDLIRSIESTIKSAENNDVSGLSTALELNYLTMKAMNERKREMWLASNYKKYNDFRIFIMGIQGNQQIFGDGVIYEGVSDEKQVFRGQTGAMDNIIPFEDTFTGIDNFYEENELTAYLMDLRRYRPPCVQNYIRDLKEKMTQIDLFNLVGKYTNNLPIIYLLGIVCEIYNFRFGHWNFVKKYIMENTKYSVATGGTPISTWLPNQMKAVEKYYNMLKLKLGSNLNEIETELFNKIDSSMKTMVENNYA